MDLDKTKKHYKWDPYSGDYSKSYVSYERRQSRRKQMTRTFLVALYIVVLIVAIISIYRYFD